MALIEREMPVNKVSDLLSVYANRIWTIFNYWIKISYSEADHRGLINIGIDETSSRKGHDYLTVAIDLDCLISQNTCFYWFIVTIRT
jgi:hypothetical protein